MNYMFIGAHPDDIEFGCGGYIHTLKDDNVLFVIVTNSTNPVRVSEQINACSRFCIKHIFLDETDGEIRHTSSSVDKIRQLIESFKPDKVFTHHPNDIHQDHKVVSNIVKSAVYLFRHISLIYFMSWSTQYLSFCPNYYIDITDCIENKKIILDCHESQIVKYKERGYDFREECIDWNKVFGSRIGVKYAEGFVVDKLVE